MEKKQGTEGVMYTYVCTIKNNVLSLKLITNV